MGKGLEEPPPQSRVAGGWQTGPGAWGIPSWAQGVPQTLQSQVLPPLTSKPLCFLTKASIH